MSLLRDETPRLPYSPLHPTAALRGSHLAFAVPALPSGAPGGKLPRQPRTYVPSLCVRVQPMSTGHAFPHPVASEAMPMLLEMAYY